MTAWTLLSLAAVLVYWTVVCGVVLLAIVLSRCAWDMWLHRDRFVR